MSKIYVFIEKNGSATITLSAISVQDAWDTLEEIVYHRDNFRLEDEGDYIEEKYDSPYLRYGGTDGG